MEAQKKSAAKAKNAKKGGFNAFVVILLSFVISISFFNFVLGAPSNFDEAGHPVNLLGTMYLGGFVVPIIQGLLVLVLILSVERLIALAKAKGSKSVDKFVKELKAALEADNVEEAKAICAKQGGSIGNAVLSAVEAYAAMAKETSLKKENRIAAIRNALDEAINMEMPTLQQNMPIIFTNTTLGTLMGLFGTVLGMIKSFQALGQSGAPDSAALSAGISEALVNTAFGIATGALAVITYNFYTNKIDNLTYAIDEIGFSIVATFAATH